VYIAVEAAIAKAPAGTDPQSRTPTTSSSLSCDDLTMRTTVLVATRNRAEQLDRCLSSIERDTSRTDREIIVVDNGSTDRTRDVLASHDVVALRLARPGKCRALNLGLRAAHGEIILFTDDDVTVEPGWTDAISTAFTDPTVDAVGGRVIPRFEGPGPPAWMSDERFFRAITLWDEGTEPFRMSRDRYPVGANMAFRSSSLPREPFNPRFGHTGRASLGHDEWELFDRLIDSHIVLYEPRAVVSHWLDANRLSFDAVRGKVFQIAVGATRRQNAGDSLPTYPRRAARALRVARMAVAIRRRTRHDDLDAVSAIGELRAFQDAAVHMETLFASFPRLSEWVSTKV
jgi:glycosyltransferase involved in cell wall biosynthesis